MSDIIYSAHVFEIESILNSPRNCCIFSITDEKAIYSFYFKFPLFPLIHNVLKSMPPAKISKGPKNWVGSSLEKNVSTFPGSN